MEMSFDDRIDALAHAIAVAEGYFASGPHNGHSLPYFINNPGDLKVSSIPDVGKVNFKLVFANADEGWLALRTQLRLIAGRKSHVYTIDDTMRQLAMKWTGNDNPESWLANVLNDLREHGLTLTGDSTLRDCLEC